MPSCCYKHFDYYSDCGHQIETVIRTLGCPDAGPDHPDPDGVAGRAGGGLCPNCEDFHLSTPAENSIDEGHEGDANEEIINHREGLRKCEKKNEELMKIIANLALTRPIEKILAEAQGETIEGLDNCLGSTRIEFEFRSQQATPGGNDVTTTTMMEMFERNIKMLKGKFEEQSNKAKADIMNECEEGIEQLLEAVKKSSL